MWCLLYQGCLSTIAAETGDIFHTNVPKVCRGDLCSSSDNRKSFRRSSESCSGCHVWKDPLLGRCGAISARLWDRESESKLHDMKSMGIKKPVITKMGQYLIPKIWWISSHPEMSSPWWFPDEPLVSKRPSLVMRLQRHRCCASASMCIWRPWLHCCPVELTRFAARMIRIISSSTSVRLLMVPVLIQQLMMVT